MSAMDIVSTVTILINLGLDIKNRLHSLDQAAEELQLLTTNLEILLTVFESPRNEDIFKTNALQFVRILDVLESIERSCRECAKALDIDLAGATIATKTESRGKKLVYSVVSAVFLQDMVRQGRTNGKETVDSAVVQKPTLHENLLDLDLSTDFANINRVVGSLMKECEYLRGRLREATLFPDSSAVQDYQAENPEAASIWKDRFQKDELDASILRYETIYVSWARFIPTGIHETGNIDLVRQHGSRYCIDQSGTCRLSTIRPLWLPALRSALDPLQKGYVKPHDYFNLLHDSFLSETLRRLALESAGYGKLVECERESGDLPLPAAIESPSDHVGWISAQSSWNQATTPSSLTFNDTAQDVHVYVRYLQTGQIERKSLSKRVRPIGGISLGAALSIRHELEAGDHAWSGDLHITEFKACYGAWYIITAGVVSTAIVFSRCHATMTTLQLLPYPEFECTLLGPSKAFAHPPKVGEKVQIGYDGLWYDSKVTVVDGDEIEYIDWDSAPEQVPTDITEAQDDSQGDEKDSGSFFFPDKQLTQLGKGTRRLWRTWRRNLQRYDVRPYRCFHIGDTIQAPVMYPDFRYHYHLTDNSELYLPARIVDVQGDQYVIEFNLVPESGTKGENPFDFHRVTVGMDRVRPFTAGPRPVLGIQSAKPSGWSSFQGVRLCNLEDLLERGLWDNDRDSQRT
ncbi:uncharacterized protein B0T15DRAFT_566133 [Chaetomium strumarium]|uniref:Uncharacterized protein n=1 Tax=Chaetomium strumarium TaxID=1170767 RepID=A0AAJ0H001_9PEZI|nr:hypothetical protein B0T15DRAFT_566133 [Chaetomium strumarium]